MGPATVWPEEGPLRARCLRPGLGHAPPEFDLPCGVYAYYRPRMPWPTSVNGAIRAWGRIVRHERGFRCEYAQIVALTEPEAPRPCIGERIEGDDPARDRRPLRRPHSAPAGTDVIRGLAG